MDMRWQEVKRWSGTEAGGENDCSNVCYGRRRVVCVGKIRYCESISGSRELSFAFCQFYCSRADELGIFVTNC
jgi:hypothetical protein